MTASGGIGNIKNHFVAFLGEFVGTFLFLFFAYGGTQTANQATQADSSVIASPDLNQLLYISLIFGFSLAINVWIFFRVSGGLFNPAVTLALCIVGVVGPVRSIFIVVAQILASITAAAAVRGLTPGDDVLFRCALSSGTSVTQGIFLEMFFTIELVFTILMLAAEKTKATFVAPVGIGLALFVAELMGVYWTGGALNPARAFGADVIGGFRGYHWIYWIGPFLGAILAAGFYKLIKFLDYEEVNGTQDLSAQEEQELADEKARKNEEKRRKQSFIVHRFRHLNRKHQANFGNERGNGTGIRRSDDRRHSTSPSYNGAPAQHHGRPRSGHRPSTSPNRTRLGGVGRQENMRVIQHEPMSQYRVSGERYVQDIDAQDGVRIPIKSY